MRIGEVARRAGVPVATLRAWERRYGLLHPDRTEGGHRVYGEADVARVRQVVALVDAGLQPSAAARMLEAPVPAEGDAGPYVAAFWRAAEAFDDGRARRVLVEAAAVLPTEMWLDAVLVPVLRRAGLDWRASPRNVAREHFVSTLTRAHLLQHLADRLDRGAPLVLAAAPAGENHDMGVVMAATVLAAHGWHPVVLGAQTPWASLESLVAELGPKVLLVGGELRPPATRLLATWAPPPACAVVVGGKGFRPADVARLPTGTFHDGPYAALPGVVGTATAPGRRRRQARS